MLDNALIQLIIQVMLEGETAAGIPGTPIAQSFQPTAQGVNTEPTLYLQKLPGDYRRGWVQRSDAWQPVTVASFTGSILGNVLTVSAVATGTINVGNALLGAGIPGGVFIAEGGTGTGGTGTYDLTAAVVPPVGSEAMTTAGETMVHTEIQQYESTFQLSALATQNASTPAQMTASDILNLAASILQSTATIATLEAQGVGIYKIGTVRNPPFLDDREQFEMLPSLDFTLTHQQIITINRPVIEEFEEQVLTV